MASKKRCIIANCDDKSDLEKKSEHCFPANAELNYKWREAIRNYASKLNYLH